MKQNYCELNQKVVYAGKCIDCGRLFKSKRDKEEIAELEAAILKSEEHLDETEKSTLVIDHFVWKCEYLIKKVTLIKPLTNKEETHIGQEFPGAYHQSELDVYLKRS